MRSGGVIELVDMDLLFTSDDGSITETNGVSRFCNTLCDAAGHLGIDLRIATQFESLLTKSGFEKAEIMVQKLPMGVWPKDQRLKEIGMFHREQFNRGLQGIAMGLFTRALKWSPEQIEVYLAHVRQDLFDRKKHGYWST